MINEPKLKFSFMIVPFRIKENSKKKSSEKLDNSFFKKVENNDNKYIKLYKHIKNSINNDNSNHYISEYILDKSNYFTHYNRPIEFFIDKHNEQFKVLGYVDDIRCFLFNETIGFLVYSFIFNNSIDIDLYCEIINLLKKIDREESLNNFSIYSDEQIIDLKNELKLITSNFNKETEIFFQHNTEDYVSAIMFNSFTFEQKVDEQILLNYLECLKKSKSKEFHVLKAKNYEYLNTFEGIYFGFSTQGIGNVNYIVDDNRKNFLYRNYDIIKQDYLLMMLLLLNQEYTLIDFCIYFSEEFCDKDLFNKNKMFENSNRLYKFKISNTYSTVSHLDHYNQFYQIYYKVLNIHNLLNEINEKQNSIYSTYENNRLSRAHKNEYVITILVALVSIILTIPNLILNLNSTDSRVLIWTIVALGIYLFIALILIITNFRRKR